MASKIFRKASLERLNTPDQLDVAITVIQPRAWLSVAMIILAFSVVLIWSVIGSVPTRVQGRGILTRGGGMIQVVSLAGGQVQEIVAQVGHTIKQGQVVARVYTPELLNKIRNLRADLDDARERHQRLEDYHTRNLAATRANLETKRSNLKLQHDSLIERRAFFTDQLSKQQKILERGLITPGVVDSTRSQLNTIVDRINDIQLNFGEIEKTIFTMEREAERDILGSRDTLDEMGRELRRQESVLRLQSLVKSIHAGRVVEVRAKIGDVIGSGDTILVMENPKQKMEALIYVNPADGKKIELGMEIDISPTTVRQEEYGAILGIVTQVSKYPASPDVIHQTIPNKALVEELLTEGAPIEVHADLIPDHRTPSGYKWTSSIGPDVRIQVGTMAECSVRVKDRRPITLVLPYFKKLLGIS